MGREGRNPPILAKFNITLSNIRQHNPRFRDYQRRRSQHEKAATYLQVTGDKIKQNTTRRKEIDDDDDDWSDTEENGSIDEIENDGQFGNGSYQHQQEYYQQQQRNYQQQYYQDQQQNHQHYDNSRSTFVERNG